MILTVDPALKNNVEYTLWRWEEKWKCQAGNVPFIGEILGEGDDPKAALADAIAKLDAAFETLNHQEDPMETQAAKDVLAERQRQIEIEGWTPERDDEEHGEGQLAEAAACYAIAAADPDGSCTPIESLSGPWPWDRKWWKPSDDPRRNLVKAGALILAEIERLDRAAGR